MQLSQMRYFLEIAKTGNISAAAQNLYVSQPALSQAVRSLEAELGIALLIRRPKSVTLTDAGEQFALHAEKILGSADQLSDLMQNYSQLRGGSLRLGALWIAGYLEIFSLLHSYRLALPDIRYRLTFEGSRELLKLLLARKLHGIFIISSPDGLSQMKELYYLRLADEEYVTIIPRDNPLSEKEIISVSDLGKETLIMPSPDSPFSLQLKALFQTYGIDPPCLCESSLSDIVGQMVGEGLGIAFASVCVARKICPENCRIVPMAEKIHRTVYYVTLNELLDYPTVKSFTDYVAHYEFCDQQFNPPGKRGI